MKNARLLLNVILLLPIIVWGQSKKVFQNQTLRYSELAAILNHSKLDTIIFNGVTFNNDLGMRQWEDSVYGEFSVSNPIRVTRKINAVEFTDCTFSTSIFFEGRFEGDVVFVGCKGPSELIFQNCVIKGLWIEKSNFTIIFVEHSIIKDADINADGKPTIVLFRIEVKDGYIDITGVHIEIRESRFQLKGESEIENEGDSNPWTAVRNSQFDQLDSGYLQFKQENGFAIVTNSTFLGGVDFYGDGDKVTWNLNDNIFKKEVGFRSVAEIGPASYLNFSEIYANRPLGWHIEKGGKIVFYEGSMDQIADERYYTNLLRMHKRFHNFYLDGGDIYSANLVYVRIKDLETRHLIYQYEKSPSFDTWVRIGLNKLLKFYTSYGTDPSKAIIISMWVIFGFGVFYFFFPSDWDVHSKPRLVQDFRTFIEKNDKGYFRPLLSLIGGFAISLINALTLSLNAFVTLGFGNIPTHGIARYFTIIEGFLGWFLLTLFSVALISQSTY